MSEWKVFSDRLKLELEKNKMTQKELAGRIKSTEVSISKYVNGKRIPKGPVIVAMAKVLGVTSDYLMGLTKERNG